MSLTSELVEELRELAEGGRIESVSSFVAEAVAEKLSRHRSARAWLDCLVAEGRLRDPYRWEAAERRAAGVFARLDEADRS